VLTTTTTTTTCGSLQSRGPSDSPLYAIQTCPPPAPAPQPPPPNPTRPPAHQVNHPDVGQLTAIAANCFTAQDLLRMERVLLESIDFKITNQTGYSFLHLYAQGLSGIEPLIAASAVYLLVGARVFLPALLCKD